MEGKTGDERRARFVCVIALAHRGRALAVVSDFVEGIIAEEPRGAGRIRLRSRFLLPELGRTFAEISQEEKNRLSHRGKAFRKMRDILSHPSF